jgi:hypothetical protein
MAGEFPFINTDFCFISTTGRGGVDPVFRLRTYPVRCLYWQRWGHQKSPPPPTMVLMKQEPKVPSSTRRKNPKAKLRSDLM